MNNIKVLGTGCANCKTTLKLIEAAANSHGIEIALEKVEEMSEIVAYGVMSTPGVVLNGKVVHAGGVPSPDKIDEWLSESMVDASDGEQSKPASNCCS